MGSLFKPSTPTPPPPPPPPPPTRIRDEINRVEQVPVTNPDGSITYITRELPKTPEELAQEQELTRIMTEALDEIERLSDADYTPDAATTQVLDAWAQERQKLLQDDVSRRTEQEETTLARRGLADSSAARTLRRQRQLDEQGARVQIQREREVLAHDMRQQRIGQQQSLYSIASTQQDADVARKQQSALAGQSQLISQNAARQASLLDYYNRQSRPVSQPSIFSQVISPLTQLTGLGSLGSVFGR